MDYNELFDMVFDGLRKFLYPEEWIAIDLLLSKTELLTLLLVDRNEEIIMSRIADYINIPMSTATGLVERLVKKGYIERTRSESDRRIVVIRPTGDGKKLAGEFKDTIKGYIRLVDEALTDDERKHLLSIFMKITSILAEKEGSYKGPEEGESLVKKILID